MSIPIALIEYWERFCAVAGSVDRARFYEAFYFGDNEELANSLAELVLRGTKRATAGSLWSYEHEGKRIRSQAISVSSPTGQVFHCASSRQLKSMS
jgi:hypothetical protein